MKKVRSLLILLLAALMLTVFVGCNPDAGLDEGVSGGDSTEKVGFNKVATGDLIISKFYLGGEHEASAESGNLPIIDNCKFIAVKNRGLEDIDLSDYYIGYRKPKDENFTSLMPLPHATLASGKTLYLINSFQGSLAYLYDMFPNFLTLPDVGISSEIAVDSFYTGVKGYYDGTTTVELVMNPIDNGRVDSKDHVIYDGWDIVDEVIVDNTNPARKTALLRNDDLSWESLTWNKAEDFARLDSEKGAVIHDFTFATLKKDVIDVYLDGDDNTNPVDGKPEKYYGLPNTVFSDLKKEASDAGYKVYLLGKYFDFYVAKDSWVIRQDTKDDLAVWSYCDYAYNILAEKIANLKKDAEGNPIEPDYTKLDDSIKYYHMDSNYANEFKKLAEADGFTNVTVASGSLSMQINDSEILMQDYDGWHVVPNIPVPTKIVEDAKILDEDFAITEFFFGRNSCKYMAITNISKEEKSLAGYAHGCLGSDGKIFYNSYDKKNYIFALPSVTVFPGRTIFILGKPAENFESGDNGFTNMDKENLIELTIDSTNEVKDKNAYFVSTFDAGAKTPKYPTLFKGTEKDTAVAFDTIKVKNPSNVSPKDYPVNDHAYRRIIDRSTNTSTGWDVYKAKNAKNVEALFDNGLLELK